jgi:hypothetical protein
MRTGQGGDKPRPYDNILRTGPLFSRVGRRGPG